MSNAQLVVDVAWLLVDCLIVVTVLCYGPREFPTLPRLAFYMGLVISASLTASIEVILTRGFDRLLIVPLVFGSNLLMSGLFIAMFLTRRSRRGQSFTIALNKMIGSSLASIGVYLYAPKALFTTTVLLPVLYIGIFIVDAAYLALIASTYSRRPGPAETLGVSHEAEHLADRG